MKTVKEIENLKGKKILLRTDFDIPVLINDRFKIAETFRIKRQKAMIDYLMDKGAKVVVVSHISSTDSFEPILFQLSEILDREIEIIQFDELGSSKLKANKLILLDNVRRWYGEKENNADFAKQLAADFDLYVNNAFAVCHRNHASVSAIAKFLPNYAGLLVEEEINRLSEAVNSPKDGKVIIIGGAKADTKAPVINNLIAGAEKIIVGGVVANDIFKERGMDIDDSLVDKNSKELLAGLDIYDSRLVLADDFNAPGGKILDIGPASIKKFTNLIKQAKMVIWNGPMGLFENPDYAAGTNELARAIAESSAYKIVGGGDTIAAISKLKDVDMSKFNFISTGGGAMLAFLAGEKLPGLEALGYYKN